MNLLQNIIYYISILLLLTNICSSEYSSEFHFPNEREEIIDGFFSKSRHTNNWAVLVDTSRYWFNYRHIANVLSIYRTVKRLGIPDSNIILMLADDVACNPRNRFQATVYNNAERKLDLYGDNIEVDYRGYEVTVENFIRLLTGRHLPDTPRSKRLLSDDRSNVLVYMTGHGGEEFLKFQDTEEISSYDVADAFEQMWEKRRYNELLFMIDTCQASSMFSRVYSPNILATGSSQTGQNSYSHHLDPELGVAVIDRFTYYNLETLEYVTLQSQKTLQYLFNTYDVSLIHSTPGIRYDLFERNINKVLITDFFGAVYNIELTLKGYKLSRRNENDIPNVKQNTINENDDKIKKINNNNDLIPKNEYRMIKINHKRSAKVSPLFILGSITLISGIIFLSKIVN